MATDKEAVSYCVGMSMGGSLMQQDLGNLSPEIIAEAISDIFSGKELKFTPEQANEIIQQFVNEQGAEKYGKNKEAGEAYLAENAKKDGVTVTASGLQYEVINEGEGANPAPTSQVTVHYHGTLTDGTVFDSSVSRGEPATFGVNQVIKGWTEALQLMNKGAKYRLYIPQDLAYGANPHPGGPIEPFMALVFDVELLEIA
jgi:FKBP-type peptidyl-prolyl cis-trans isomerase FklB